VLSFVCLALGRTVELLLLLGRSCERKELEILVLRHELRVLGRQSRRVRYRAHDRALLAVLSRLLPRARWSKAFAVRPATLLRWHPRMVRRRWTFDSRRPGRPALDRDLVALIARLARENPRWGHRRIVGELAKLGVSVSEASVRKVLKAHGIAPAPRRSGPSWRAFIRQQTQSMIACAVRFLLHDRDAKFTAAFDQVFLTQGVRVIKTPIQAPNANAHAERWVRTVRQECLDWLLIFGKRQLERSSVPTSTTTTASAHTERSPSRHQTHPAR
jgi:putative transposase